MALHAGIPTGVHVLLEQRGCILLMRRARTGFFDGLWSLPGGHMEAGETVRDTARRELLEETGLVVDVGNLEYLGVVHRLSDSNRIDFFVRASRWAGQPVIMEPDKCDALEWFAPANLPDGVVPYVREAVGQGDAPWFFETGWLADA